MTQPPSATRIESPDAQAVGRYYDHEIFGVMASFDANLHVGFWLDENDQSDLEQAMVQMTDQMIRRLHPRPGDRILDVGCGNGAPAIQLAQAYNVEVVGISVSERQVARANALADAGGVANRVRFEHVDAMRLPYPDESFDGAWALESMFHMPDKRQVLAEIARVVRPGGRVPIADLIFRHSESERRGGVAANSMAVYASLSTLDEYDTIIRDAGLVPLEMTDVTAQTYRNHVAYAEWLHNGREKFVEVLGNDGFDLFVGSQTASGRMSELGYTLITARRP